MEKYTIHVILVSLILTSCCFHGCVSESSERKPKHNHREKPKHFVLVHGACLGAWSWYRLISPLKSYGHNVTAIDLAASGINPALETGIRNFSDYSKPLMDFMESIPSTEKVILVGHSFGGASISQAMELFHHKVLVAVFLTATMPGPNIPLSLILQKAVSKVASTLDNKLLYEEGTNKAATTLVIGPKYLSQVIYQFSPVEDIALGTMLFRPFRLTSGDELVFSEGKYKKVKRVFIISEDDQVLPKKLQKWIIKKNPPNMVKRTEVQIIWL